MAAEQWYCEEDEDSISGNLVGYWVRTLTSQDYFDFGPEDDEYSFKTDEEAYDAACARVKELDRMAEIAAAAPLIAKAMNLLMAYVRFCKGIFSGGELSAEAQRLGWPGTADCPVEVYIHNIAARAEAECQRLEIK